MKNLIKKIAVLTITTSMLCSCGKSNTKEIHINKGFQFGVIRSCDDRNSTILSLYDKDLNVIETKKIKYGGVGNEWCDPVVSDGHLLVNAQGVQGKKDLGLTMDINTEDGEIRFIKNDLIAASNCLFGKDYMYVCNNFNLKSTIVRMDKDGKNPLEKEFSIPIITAIYEWDDKLIVFGGEIGEEIKSYLYVLDTDLNVLKQEDITDTGCGIYSVCQYENNLYFNISSDTHDEKVYELGVLSLDDFSISTIKLDGMNAANLKIDGNKLYISNSMQEERPMFQIYDLQKKEFESYDLDQSAEKFEVNNGTVYALQDGTMYEYSLENGKATVENAVSIDTSLEGEQFYYDSVFFANE